jgi:hypothetical protein
MYNWIYLLWALELPEYMAKGKKGREGGGSFGGPF